MDNNQIPPTDNSQPPLVAPSLEPQSAPVSPEPTLITPNAVPAASAAPVVEPTMIAPTPNPEPISTAAAPEPVYNSPTEEIQNFLASTATENSELTTPVQVISPTEGQIIQTIPIINNVDPASPQMTIVNTAPPADSYLQPEIAVKSKRKAVFITSAGAFILLIAAASLLFVSHSGQSLSKRYTLVNKGVDYSFIYYSDAVPGVNIITGNSQLTGDLKTPLSASFIKYPSKGDCSNLGKTVKTVGTINIKGSSYKVCGTNTDKVVVFNDNQSKYLFEMYSIDKTTAVSTTTMSKILANYNISN
ncbi:MAG TPA: hypothetical protein VIH90_02850 [Candidatus Saccharimonadales bacterium]